MLHKVIFSLLLGALIVASQSAYAGRPFLPPIANMFLKMKEYQVMDLCAGKRERNKLKRIKICACALERTQQAGIWPVYGDDADHQKNIKNFLRDFKNLSRKITEAIRKNKDACR